MADAPAVAAPAAAPSTTATPAKPAGGAPAPASNKLPPQGAPRATDGRFQTKESNAGKVPPEGEAPPETPPAKEPFRFKTRLKVRGQEQEVDLGEEDLVRELQTGRFQASRAQKLEAELNELRGLMKPEKLEDLIRKAGGDPDEYSKQRIARMIQEETMSEEAKAASAAQRRAEEAEAKLKAREEADAGVKKELQLRQLKAKKMATYNEAIDKVGWDRTPETIYLLSETEAILRDDCKARGLAAFDFTAEELAAQAQKRMAGYVSNYFRSADTKGLMRALGKEKIAAILEETVREYEAGAVAPRPAPVVEEPPVQRPTDDRFTTPQEVDRRIREMTRKR